MRVLFLARLRALAGLLRRFAPRNDEKQIQLSNSPTRVRAHVHQRPCCLLGSGRACLLVSVSPTGAARNAGRNTAPTAPAGQAGSPHAGIAPAHERWPAERAKIAKLDRAVRSSLSPAFRTQVGFSACSMSQGA